MPLTGKKFRRSCYHYMREALEPKTRQLQFEYYLDWILCIYGIRYYYIALVAYTDFKLTRLDWTLDPMCYFVYRYSHIYDGFIMVIIMLLELFNVFCHYRLYHLKATLVWQWWHQVIVVNQDSYYNNLLSRQELEGIYQRKEAALFANLSDKAYIRWSVPSLLLRQLCKGFARFETFKNLDHVNKKFFEEKLSIMPNLSNKLRIKMLFASTAMDAISFAVQILQIIFTTLVALFIIPMMLEPYSGSYRHFATIWLYTDVVIIHYELIRLLRVGLFFANITIMASVTYAGHCHELYAKVEKVLRQLKHPRQRLPAHYLPLLAHHFREHGQVCKLVIAGGRELFNDILWAFLYSNLPINIYCIRRQVFLTQPTFILIIVWFIIAIQTIACVLVMGPLAYCCQVFHYPTKWIIKLQCLTETSQWRMLKFKYDDLYNRLIRGPKVTISIGPTTQIYYMAGVEFLMMYIAYLLMAFSQMIEFNTNAEQQ